MSRAAVQPSVQRFSRLGLPYLPLLATALSCVYFLAAEHRIAGQWGYSLDDSWIYATFARNVAGGHGYSFNPGEPIGGATGPLYVFLLAALYALFHSVIWPAKVLGILCLAASSVLVSWTVLEIIPKDRWLAALAGTLVALSPSLVWGSLSGLEFPVYLLVACCGLYFYVRKQWTLTVLFWSIGVWLRPEGVFLVAVAFLTGSKLFIKETRMPVVIGISIVAIYFLFNRSLGHSLFPNSVSVKANLHGNVIGREWGMLTQSLWLWGLSVHEGRLGLHAPVLIPLVVIGAILAFRRWPAITIYAAGFPIAFALSGASSGQNGRYIAYVIPFGIVLACIGLERTLERIHARKAAWTIGIAVLCVGWQGYIDQIMALAHGWDVQNINQMHRYIAEHVRAGMTPGDTVAVNDVGAMGFFGGCYVVDLVGLTSPRRPFPEQLKVYRPKLLIIFPDWFRQYSVRDPVTGQGVFYDADSTFKYSPVLGVQLRNNTIASRNTMCIYERMGRDQTWPRDVQLIVH